MLCCSWCNTRFICSITTCCALLCLSPAWLMSHASHIVHYIFVNGQLFANRTDPMFIMILSWNVDTFMLPLDSSQLFLKHLHFQVLAILQSRARPTHGERAHVGTTYQPELGQRRCHGRGGGRLQTGCDGHGDGILYHCSATPPSWSHAPPPTKPWFLLPLPQQRR